jgi:imidazole glycerol-phosphate synthase subunit HisF
MKIRGNFRIIPRLEIKNNFVIKGVAMEGLRKVGNPIKFASKYSNEGADEIFYDDIVASLYNRKINLNLINDVSKKINIPLIVSGGIKDLSDANKVFRNGADKIVLNTGAINNPNMIYKLAKIYGSQSTGVQVQFRKFEGNLEVFTESGRERTKRTLFDWIEEIQRLGAGEIYIVDIDIDGTQKNLNLEILEKIRKKINVSLIYGGGLHNKNKILSVKKIGYNGVLLSNLIHNQKIKCSKIISQN